MAFTVTVTGLDDLFKTLARIPQAIDRALASGGKEIATQGTKYWRSIVTVRTGRMRRALFVTVRASRGSLLVEFSIAGKGFYYLFQDQRAQWQQQLVTYLAGIGPTILRRHLQRELNRIT